MLEFLEENVTARHPNRGRKSPAVQHTIQPCPVFCTRVSCFYPPFGLSYVKCHCHSSHIELIFPSPSDSRGVRCNFSIIPTRFVFLRHPPTQLSRKKFKTPINKQHKTLAHAKRQTPKVNNSSHLPSISIKQQTAFAATTKAFQKQHHISQHCKIHTPKKLNKSIYSNPKPKKSNKNKKCKFTTSPWKISLTTMRVATFFATISLRHTTKTPSCSSMPSNSTNA